MIKSLGISESTLLILQGSVLTGDKGAGVYGVSHEVGPGAF